MRVVLYAITIATTVIFCSSALLAQRGTPPVYLKFRADKIYILDEKRVEFTADIYVGTWENAVQGLYSLSIDLVFPADLVLYDATYFTYHPQSFLGIREDITIVHKGPEALKNGHLNITISRTDGKSINGFGKVGEVQFITVSDIIGSRNVDEIPFTVKAEYVKLMDVDGNELPHETDANGATIVIVNDILARSARAANVRQVEIYPNPASDHLYIQLKNLRGNRIEIFNVAGQRIHQERVQSDQVQISTKNFRPGLYTVKIHTEEGVITRSVLLQ